MASATSHRRDSLRLGLAAGAVSASTVVSGLSAECMRIVPLSPPQYTCFVYQQTSACYWSGPQAIFFLLALVDQIVGVKTQ